MYQLYLKCAYQRLFSAFNKNGLRNGLLLHLVIHHVLRYYFLGYTTETFSTFILIFLLGSVQWLISLSLLCSDPSEFRHLQQKESQCQFAYFTHLIFNVCFFFFKEFSFMLRILCRAVLNLSINVFFQFASCKVILTVTIVTLSTSDTLVTFLSFYLAFWQAKLNSCHNKLKTGSHVVFLCTIFQD